MATPARHGHGEGPVYRDAANGTWVGAISLGWRPDGTRIRRKVTGRTKTEVRDKLKKLQAEADAGLKTSASYTLSKAVDDWAAEALDGLADKTVRSHVDLLRPVTMLIGSIPLRDLTGHDVRRALNKLWQDTGLVFTTSVGTPLDASHVRRDFRAPCMKAGVEGVWAPRELRHTFVSVMSVSGVAVEEIARLAGHASSRTTETIYRHELRPVITTGADVMDKIFTGTEREG